MKKKKSVGKSVRKHKTPTPSGDIIELILTDHKPLKKLIRIMKNMNVNVSERQEAFEHFAPLLAAHAKPEEKTLYSQMKSAEDLRPEALEAVIEHRLAEQMVNEAKQEKHEDVWSAKVKILAEMVEHHIEEEESELIPDFKRESGREERLALGRKYEQLRSMHYYEPDEEIPPAREIERPERHQTL